MSIDFATLQGLTIPEGVVTQITDASGRVLWVLPVASGPVVLQVEKITSNTYAAETSYTDETFILLDIYPTTNGTVTVTFGGITKTVTDTSGAEQPNAQQVFFGTFNGVADEVETPASGELVIDGDYRGFGCSTFATGKYSTSNVCTCVTAFVSLGTIKYIGAISGTNKQNTALTAVTFPKSVEAIARLAFWFCANLKSVKFSSGGAASIGSEAFASCTSLSDVSLAGVTNLSDMAFNGCSGLKSIHIPQSVLSIGAGVFQDCSALNNITVDSRNEHFFAADGVLFSKDKTLLYAYPTASGHYNIPESVTEVKAKAFIYCDGLISLTVPAGVTLIGSSAFYGSGLTSALFANNMGWYTASSPSATVGDPVNVRDPAAAASKLADTSGVYWIYTPEPFTIDIDGVMCSGVYGMTWGEWLESEYNTNGFFRNSELYGEEPSDEDWVLYNGLTLCTGTYENPIQVLVKELISPTTVYHLYA